MSEQLVMERLTDNLTRLRLPRTRDILPEMVKTAEDESWSYLVLLDRLLGEEIASKEQKRISSALRTSGLPYVKSIDEFDFTFQPQIDRRAVMGLFDLSLQISVNPNGCFGVIRTAVSVIRTELSERSNAGQKYNNSVAATRQHR